jgi:hypothetical protein
LSDVAWAKAEAAVKAANKIRQINNCSRLAVSRRSRCFAIGHGGTAPWLQLGLPVETVERLILVVWLEHWSIEAIHDSRISIASLALFLIANRNLVEDYLRRFDNRGETCRVRLL